MRALIAALALMACAAPDPTEQEIWLADEHPLAPAQRAWGLPLPQEYDVAQVAGAVLDSGICGPTEPDTFVWGCTQWLEGVILLRAELTPEEQARTLVHEYGHALRGWRRPGHLPESEDCPAGARGVHVFHRVAPETYSAPHGDTLHLDALLEHLETLGHSTPLIVQPRLRNHPEIADLAEQSLVTIRVLTCLDADDRPIATHGVLRILAKLEPGWPLKDEFGATEVEVTEPE